MTDQALRPCRARPCACLALLPTVPVLAGWPPLRAGTSIDKLPASAGRGVILTAGGPENRRLPRV